MLSSLPKFYSIYYQTKVMKAHKRQTTSEDQVDTLKGKDVEEVLAEIKKKKSNREDDVASAGLKSVEQIHDPEEDDKEEDGGLSQEDGQEHEQPKWHVSHGSHMVRGKMDHGMEDCVVAKRRKMNDYELGLYAIFDGHAGREVAEYLQRNLFDNILHEPDFWTDPKTAVRKAYKATDEQILGKVSGWRGGSTAVTAILINREKLIVANVGDSRGILCKRRKIEQITVDHEPDKERELVEERGGFVSQKPGNVPRVDGVLAMARAFGDGRLKDHITVEPDVRVEIVDEDTKFIVLASDGIWKVMSNEEACDCIRELDEAQSAAEELVKEAIHRGSVDDVSCVVVMFH